MRSVIRDGSSPPMRASGPPPCWSALVTPNENRKLRASATACAARNRGAESGAVSDGSPRQRSGAPASHWQPVDQGPAFRLARKGLPHGRSRQSSEGPQRSGGPAQRVDGRDRPCVVNALRAKRGPYPGAPRTGLNPPTPLSGEPQEPGPACAEPASRPSPRAAGAEPRALTAASTRARCGSDEGLPILHSAHRFCGRPSRSCQGEHECCAPAGLKGRCWSGLRCTATNCCKTGATRSPRGWRRPRGSHAKRDTQTPMLPLRGTPCLQQDDELMRILE